MSEPQTCFCSIKKVYASSSERSGLKCNMSQVTAFGANYIINGGLMSTRGEAIQNDNFSSWRRPNGQQLVSTMLAV